MLAVIPSFSQATNIGIYAGAGCSGVTHLAEYSTWLGKKADGFTENFAQDTWSSMVSDASWSTYCYKAVAGSAIATFSVPMIPADGSTLAQAASGMFDTNYQQIATSIATSGFPDAIIRIGWEMNGNWQPWRAAADPVSFITAFQRIVGIFRTVSPTFRFDWCVNVGDQEIAWEQVYPGDAYVDIIGMDIYDAHYGDSDLYPVQRWNGYVTGAHGLQAQVTFAKAHNKKLSLPEWGCCGNNSGDDPTFITNMSRWLRDNNYEYANYWDQNAAYTGLMTGGQWPYASAAYKKEFGRR
jgi:hypothetical protein